MNTYKKLDDDSYGAWIDTGYGRTAVSKPLPGDQVIITTKNGDKHTRTVVAIIDDYKSGCVVSLAPDAAIAAAATANYNAKIEASKPLKCPLTTAQKARLYDDIVNEGGEGYNPYRDDYAIPQNIEAQD